MPPKKFELLRSLESSHQEPIETIVTGVIPVWLSGTLFKNGTGRYEYGNKYYKHFFDGHACIHKFKIERGTNKVIYSNRLLNTKAYTRSLAENRLYPVFGTQDLCSNVFGRLKTVFRFHETMDNANVNVVPFGEFLVRVYIRVKIEEKSFIDLFFFIKKGNNQMYALTESNYLCQVDPKSLSVLKTIDVPKHVSTVSTNTAHPHLDKFGWLMCGINSRRGRLYYEFLRYPQSDLEPGPRGDAGLCTNAYTVARIPSSHFTKLSYFHSFGLTENYIIFLEQSLLLDLTKFFIGLFTNRTFADALVMRPNMNTLIHLVDRSTGKQVKTRYSTCPLFLFHHINAYEIKETSLKTKCNKENDADDEKSMTMR